MWTSWPWSEFWLGRTANKEYLAAHRSPFNQSLPHSQICEIVWAGLILSKVSGAHRVTSGLLSWDSGGKNAKMNRRKATVAVCYYLKLNSVSNAVFWLLSYFFFFWHLVFSFLSTLHLSFFGSYIHWRLQRPAAWWRELPASYQDLQQLLQVAGDEGVVFVEGPAALLGVVAVAGEVAEDHLQPLLIVTHLTLRQRCALVLQRHKFMWLTQEPEKPVLRWNSLLSHTES